MELSPSYRPGRRAVLAALGAAVTVSVTTRPAAASAGAVGAEAENSPARLSHKRQLRGMWITSLDNIDWPQRPGLSAERLRTDFVALLDEASAIGFNAVFVQVRPTADALWPSPFEPWSQWLTGTQGQNPGWDPLEFMARAAHERGLAFHAWFNPFRVAIQPDPTRLLPSHPARRNHDWAVVYNGEIYYNPGVPAVRAFVQQAIMDAVLRYDIDGVHIDDYFYPYPGPGTVEFPDDAAFAADSRGFTDRAAWRRDNINLMVQQLRDLVRAARPEAAYGISPFGVWRNHTSDPAGSATIACQSYDAQFSDSRAWVRNGWVDYIAPQLYWYIGFTIADYAVLAPWWAEQTAGTDAQLWIGQSASRPGAPGRPAPWQDPTELSRHLTLNATLPPIGGDIFFSARSIHIDRIGAIKRLAADHWNRPALPPLLPRLAHGTAPGPPTLQTTGDQRTIRITPWSGAEHSSPFQYALYCYDSDPGPHPPPDPARLTILLPALTVDRYQPPASAIGSWLAATAVDRAGREGPISPPLRIPANNTAIS